MVVVKGNSEKPMRGGYLLIAVFLFLALFTPAERVQSAPDEWEPVAEGIDYQEFHLPDPNNVFVTRMQRSNQNVILESSIAQGRLSGGSETVSGMSTRYDGAINYWNQTWGNRNQVVVAINGFYFGAPEELPGVPWSGQVHSGWYAKRFWEGESGSGFAWKMDREAIIGECISHPSDKQVVNYIRTGSVIATQEFQGINVPRQDNQFILYTPQYDANTQTSGAQAVEVLVELSRPSLIALTSDMTRGKIIKIRDNQGSTSIPFDHVVLSMHGVAKTEFLAKGIVEGDEVGIAQRIKNCNSALTYDWSYTYASVGGAFYFLKNGVIQDFSGDPQANVRDPRTAIAFNNDYIFFIVVDGRDVWYSLGMTIPQMASFAKNVLGATWGIAQDGGGSSTMVVNGEVKNNSYCNITICEGKMFLPIIVNPGEGRQSQEDEAAGPGVPIPPVSSTPPPPQLSGDGLPLTSDYYVYSRDASGTMLQRLVANGMLMVVVEPKEQSNTFSANTGVLTRTEAQVRLGPGTNYAVVDTVPAATLGFIVDHSNGLNGVKAMGSFWWKVLLEVGNVDVIGWVPEETLMPLPR